MIKQRCLVLDIETSPLEAYVWGLKDQNISLSQIKEDWYVLAWAAKWLDEPASSIIYHDQRHMKDVRDDKKILTILWKLLDEADIVITQNGKAFDVRKLNARFLIHGMEPPRPFEQIDTYKVADKVAEFTSHKLEYMTDKLCTKYKKLTHKKYPGWSLWTECLAGNKDAWDEMKKYNIHDVLSTEELYTKLRPWMPKNTPSVFHVANLARECPRCGAKGQMQARGYTYTKTTVSQRYQCKACASWSQGTSSKKKASENE